MPNGTRVCLEGESPLADRKRALHGYVNLRHSQTGYGVPAQVALVGVFRRQERCGVHPPATALSEIHIGAGYDVRTRDIVKAETRRILLEQPIDGESGPCP